MFILFTGIKLFLEGSAKSYWDEKHGKNKTKYRARETYINQVILLFGGMFKLFSKRE